MAAINTLSKIYCVCCWWRLYYNSVDASWPLFMAKLPASNITAMNSPEEGRAVCVRDVTTYISVMQLPCMLKERSFDIMKCDQLLDQR